MTFLKGSRGVRPNTNSYYLVVIVRKIDNQEETKIYRAKEDILFACSHVNEWEGQKADQNFHQSSNNVSGL